MKKMPLGGIKLKQDMICPGPLMEDALSEAVAEFFRNIRPGRERLFDYYRGEQPVPKGPSIRGRPNSLLWVPFPRYITEIHTGYFLGFPPTPLLSRKTLLENLPLISDAESELRQKVKEAAEGWNAALKQGI